MIWIYRLIYPFLFLLGFPFYLRRMVKRGGYAHNFKHRLGYLTRAGTLPEGKRRIWLQAVSVGELLACEPLIEGLKERGCEIYLTTTTSTGYVIAATRLRAKDKVDYLGYFPFDFLPCSTMAWNRIRPDVAILFESDIWPEHIHQARTRDVPMLLVNARMSDRSFQRYKKGKGVGAFVFDYFSAILVASEQDERRFKELGAEEDRVVMTGNLKLDVDMDPLLDERAKAALRAEIGFRDDGNGQQPLVVIGASTWPGEEAALLLLFEEARARGLRCNLILVPRHAERRAEIEALLSTQDLPYHFRSRGAIGPTAPQIYVADTTGELKQFLQIADIAFIGKSLPPHSEGQTPVEAAILAKPIVFGPGMSNFRTISGSLQEAGAAEQVVSAAAMRLKVLELLESPAKREILSKNCKRWHRANLGAAERTLEVIDHYLTDGCDDDD